MKEKLKDFSFIKEKLKDYSFIKEKQKNSISIRIFNHVSFEKEFHAVFFLKFISLTKQGW